MFNYFYYLFALSILAAIPLFKYASKEKPQADNFKEGTIALRLGGLTFFVLLITIILSPFSYASGGGFLGNYWSEHKYSHLEVFLYELLPGITFSLYFVLFFLGKASFVTKILSTIFLIFTYLLFYVGGCFTFGFLDVLTGGLGALLLKILLPQKLPVKNGLLFLIGCLTGALGIALADKFADPGNTEYYGKTILLGCLPWQIVIGLLLTFRYGSKDKNVEETDWDNYEN